MRKKILSYFIFIVLIGLLTACDKGPLKGYKRITKIFGYQMLSDMDTGTKAGQGVLLMGNGIIKTEQDSAVSEPNLGGGFFFEVPLRKPFGGSDLMKGFQKLSDGDSIVFMMLADTFFSKYNFNVKMPDNVKPGSYVKFYLQVTQLLDSAEYDYYLENKEIENKVMAHQMFDAYLKMSGITEAPDNNGIIRVVEKKGTGKSPIFGQTVTVNYICLTMTGKEIRNTYMEGKPEVYVLGDSKMVDGLNLALIKMQKGEKSRLIIPYYLAYKAEGTTTVPPYTHLIMDVELVDFK
jgi:FKBP-type peptidyl-prolyl cis-trans isomerase